MTRTRPVHGWKEYNSPPLSFQRLTSYQEHVNTLYTNKLAFNSKYFLNRQDCVRTQGFRATVQYFIPAAD